MTQRFSIRTASMWFADLNGRPENLMMFSWPNWVSAVSQVVMIGLDIMCIKSMLMHDTPRKDMPCHAFSRTNDHHDAIRHG
jgi:hypothetical protein